MSPQLALTLEDSGSLASTLPSRPPIRHMCAGCQQRPARFQYRGHVKADRFHTLCFQCYRAALDRARAEVRRAGVTPADARYEDLARRRRRAQIAARHALASVP